MAACKMYGACVWEEGNLKCWCQEFDPDGGDLKRCGVCNHKRGFHLNEIVTEEYVLAPKSYGHCNWEGKCRCQEFDEDADAPRMCDSCAHHRGFHKPEFHHQAKQTPPPLAQFSAHSSLSLSVDVEGQHHPPCSTDIPALKKVKVEQGEASSFKNAVESSAAPHHDAPPLFVPISTPVSSEGMEPPPQPPPSLPKAPTQFSSKLVQILEKQKALTEHAGVELIQEGGKWRVRCSACETTVSVGPSTSLKNFEEHIYTVRHKAKYEAHLGRKEKQEADESSEQRTRAEEQRIAVEQSAQKWVAPYAEEGIELVEGGLWRYLWCSTTPARFTNGDANIRLHLKGKEHGKKGEARSTTEHPGQPGGETLYSKCYIKVHLSQENKQRKAITRRTIKGRPQPPGEAPAGPSRSLTPEGAGGVEPNTGQKRESM